MAISGPIGAVLALCANQGFDFGAHQIGEDLQTDGGRGGQQTLAHVLRERGQMSFQALGQLGRQRVTSFAGRRLTRRRADFSGRDGTCDDGMGSSSATSRSTEA